MRYLEGTKNLAVKCGQSDFGALIGFSDAEWAGVGQQPNMFPLSGGRSKKTLALSPAEADDVAPSQAAQESIWLRRLLTDLGVEATPTVVLEDNRGAIAKSPLHN